MTKQLDQLESKLAGTLLDNLSAEASTASIRISFFDSDDPTTSRTPDASTLKFCIDPENTQGKKSEWIRCASHSTSNGITTLSTVTRGLQRDATIDLTGSASRAQSWDASTTPVGVSTEPHNLNLIRAYLVSGEQIPGNIDLAGTLEVDGITTVNDKLQFSDTDTYIDNVATDMVFKDANNSLTTLSDLTAAAGTDTKARVSANDTTSGFLNGKLVAGDNITFTKNNDGANETLTIASPATTRYAVDSVGTDSYAITLTPTLSAYSDGLQIHFEAGTANTGPSTLNIDSLGAIPIINGDYYATITGDILEDQKVTGLVSVKSVTFNAVFTGGETSGTLSSNWTYKTGVYSVEFSNGDRRDVTLTKGATSATWSGGLSGAATASAEAQWFQLTTQSSALVGENDGSLQHYHDLLTNSRLAQRHFYQLSHADVSGTGTAVGPASGKFTVQTAATDNDIAKIFINTRASDANTTLSVHDKNPEFRVAGSFGSATAQEGFIGFINGAIIGTSLEDSTMTLSHFGFIVQDGTLYISVANGTTQSKTDISGSVPSVTAGHIFRATFDGTTATFYVDGTNVGTIATAYVPASNLNAFIGAVIADATAVAKQLRLLSSGWVVHDES